MRLRKLLGIWALFLAACSGETVARPPPPPVDWPSFVHAAPDAGALAPTAKESSLALDYLRALGSTSSAQLARLYADDGRFSFPGMDDAHDRDGAVGSHDALFGAFDQRTFVASRLWRTPGEQTVEWTMSGVQNRDWMGVRASRKPVTIKGITLLWTNDDGTLADAHVYFDVAVAKAQLGAGPKELTGLPAPAVVAGTPQIVDRTTPPPPHSTIVRTALDALENGVLSAYLDAMTDDVDLHTLDRAEPLRGKEAEGAYYKAMHKSIAQLDATIQNEWAVGSFAIVEYSLAGEQVGLIGWVPLQRDRVVKEHLVDVNEIREGKIARIWRFSNPSELVSP